MTNSVCLNSEAFHQGFSLFAKKKAPITIAADDKFATSFLIFEKKGMIFHENRLTADDSHEISCIICYF